METVIKIEHKFDVGTPISAQAAHMRLYADLLEGKGSNVKTGKKQAAAVEEETQEEETEVEAEAEEEAADEEFAPKKKAGKKKAADFGDDEEEAEEVPPKKAKAPTLDDVNEACKARARRTSFEDTKAFMLKKFKTSSTIKLKPEQYPAVIQAMKGA